MTASQPPPAKTVETTQIRFDAAGLVPVIVQQWDSGEVLMLAWMDAEALGRTVSTGLATYWSRSRREYWVKGETSGNLQRVRELRTDCDRDAILLRVDQAGVACHTGARSCFDTGAIDVVPGGAVPSPPTNDAGGASG